MKTVHATVIVLQCVTMILWMLVTDARVREMEFDVLWLHVDVSDLQVWQTQEKHENMVLPPYKTGEPDMASY